MKRFFQACFCFLAGCLILAFPSVLQASSATWNVDADGTWGTASNWTSGGPPGSGNIATLGNKITADRVITLGGVTTISTLIFNDNNQYTVTGSTLTLSAGTGGVITQSGSGNDLISSNVLSNSSSIKLGGTGTGTITISGVISGSASLQDNSASAKLILSNANTYGGTTTVTASGGVLNIQNNSAMSSGAVTISSGAQLELEGTLSGAVANAITITGYGITVGGIGTGAIQNVSGNNTISGAITFNPSSSIVSESGTLTLSGVLSGVTDKRFGYTGGGGTGTIILSGSLGNTGNASWTLQSGTLELNKTGVGVYAISGGAFNIGNNDGIGTVTAKLDQNDQIIDTAGVSIWETGLLDLNGKNDTIASLSMMAGSISTGAGTLTLNGDVTGNADSATAAISGNLALGSSTRTFTIADGPAASDMNISAVIPTTTAGITKAGAGTLVLSGNNAYSGTTTVSAGTLVAGANNALGTTGGATTVSNGASLGFQGDITYSTAEAVSIIGTGVSSSGAIKNISGANSFAGAVTMTGDSTIGADAGTLTLSGGISGAYNLTKAGTGTVTLTGTDSFSGSTTINAGTLEAGAANALGSTSGVTINTGGTLLFSGTGDRFKDTATVALAGGTIDMNNKTEVMGAMTLSGNSVITLHDDATHGDLTFASAAYTSGTLTINGWHGTAGDGVNPGSGGTDDRIFITGSPSQTFLNSVTFTGFAAGADWASSTHELSPHHDIPEPGTIVGGVLLSGFVALRYLRRRFSRKIS